MLLIHGGFVDGSGWRGVYDLLKKDGYDVSIVQNPTNSLADDVAVTKRMLAAQNGPAILVGHSYGGVVITEAGNDPKVAGLVYIAAFAPDQGESVAALIKNPRRVRRCRRSCHLRTVICSSIERSLRVICGRRERLTRRPSWRNPQVPWGVEALNGAVTEPAWKAKPSWYLVATDDRMIPPDAQRAMSKRAGSTVAEVKGSHAVDASQPKARCRSHCEGGKRRGVGCAVGDTD